jgi:hypothetical protein
MAVSYNILIGDEVNTKLEEFTIFYNEKKSNVMTKTQMINLLLITVFKHHSQSKLNDYIKALVPGKGENEFKSKKQIANYAVRNKN